MLANHKVLSANIPINALKDIFLLIFFYYKIIATFKGTL